MRHEQKVKLARRHMTKTEIAGGVSVFTTDWWLRNKKRKTEKVKKREVVAKRKSAERKARYDKRILAAVS